VPLQLPLTCHNLKNSCRLQYQSLTRPSLSFGNQAPAPRSIVPSPSLSLVLVVVVGFPFYQLLLVVLRLTIDNVSVYQHDNDEGFSYRKSGVQFNVNGPCGIMMRGLVGGYFGGWLRLRGFASTMAPLYRSNWRMGRGQDISREIESSPSYIGERMPLEHIVQWLTPF
jgi:hypothetical protein